MEHRLEKCI